MHLEFRHCTSFGEVNDTLFSFIAVLNTFSCGRSTRYLYALYLEVGVLKSHVSLLHLQISEDSWSWAKN